MYFVKLWIILCISVLFNISLQASNIQFMTHNIKNYTFTDTNGELRGKKNSGKRAFTVELVREMMDETGCTKEFIEVPFKRGYKILTTKDNFALFNISRTKEREDQVKWVGPILEDKSFFYKLKHTPISIRTIEDAKKADSICVLRGAMHYKALLKQGFTNLVQNNSYVGCFEMLKKQRVSLTVSADNSLHGKLISADIGKDEIVQLPPLVTKSDGYIAFSKNVKDDMVMQWQNALEKIKKSGKYKEIFKEYYLIKKR